MIKGRCEVPTEHEKRIWPISFAAVPRIGECVIDKDNTVMLEVKTVIYHDSCGFAEVIIVLK